MTENSNSSQTVFIVDDDPAIRIGMQALMESVNIEHEIFASADEFLQREEDHRAGCLVLDIRMPGLGGLELQEELISRGNTLPIIFITGHGDVPMAGWKDLLSHYRIGASGIAIGDTRACVTGETVDGSSFESCDAISTLEPQPSRKHLRGKTPH